MTEKMRLLIKKEFFKNVTMQNEVNKNSENNIFFFFLKEGRRILGRLWEFFLG
jgi:hypothetical protein